MSGDELRGPLRIDTSQIESERPRMDRRASPPSWRSGRQPSQAVTRRSASYLRAVDAHPARLERRIVQTFNRSDVVRKRIAPRAESLADVRTQLSELSDADLRASCSRCSNPWRPSEPVLRSWPRKPQRGGVRCRRRRSKPLRRQR
jgi:hypothetical protein